MDLVHGSMALGVYGSLSRADCRAVRQASAPILVLRLGVCRERFIGVGIAGSGDANG